MDVQQMTNASQATSVLVSILRSHLPHKILLLLPGGTAAKIGVMALQQLSEQERVQITVSLTDERYGAPNHDQSNWLMLHNQGLPADIQTLPVLTGEDQQQTAANWAKQLDTHCANKLLIALFGVGADYHTAGLKPGYQYNDHGTVVSYQAEDFARISIAPSLIKDIDQAVVYAEGVEKAQAVKQLTQGGNAQDQPMQLLHQAKSCVVLYVTEDKTA